MNFLKQKKGQFGSLQAAAIGLGVFFVIVALIATMLGEFQNTQVTDTAGCNSTARTACPLEYNITNQGLLDTETLSNFGTVVVVVIVMVVILGLLFLFQRGRR